MSNSKTFEHDRLALFADHGFRAESRWLEDAAGKKTYALVREVGGPKTVLVHGGLSEAGVWHRLAGLLPGSVIVPDRPGHGLTDLVDYTGVDYRQAAVDWMRHVVDELGDGKVDLVGNSMGGYFCLVLALAHPERVRRIAIVGAPAGVDRELPLFLRLWGKPISGHLVAAMMKRMQDPEQLRERVFASMVAHPERISTAALKVGLAAASKPGFQPMARSMIHAVSDLGGWRPAMNIREEVASLATPTLFLWGDKDSFAPPSSGEDLARRMPHARFELVPDAGHIPQLDDPETLAASITRYFSDARSIAA